MLSHKIATFVLLTGTWLPVSGCMRRPTTQPENRQATLDVVRHYGLCSASRPTEAVKHSAVRVSVPIKPSVESEPYVASITSYFVQRNFDQLEQEAHDARIGKERFAGGSWKIYNFYAGVSLPGRKTPADESVWNTYLAITKDWVAAKPESATARIALADAHLALAWKARGSGYAHAVSDQSWDTFHSEAALAREALVEAAKRKERCPYWYVLMQTVALADGWDPQDARELFDRAVAFEPDFYYFYQNYATYLEPRWFGEEGEGEAFAEESSLHVGGDQGEIIYFETASAVVCPCDQEPDRLSKMSWPRIQLGYEAIERLYGSSILKRNRFAYMAYVAKDRSAARRVFGEIGESWDNGVWSSRNEFEEARAWAMNGVEEPASAAN